MPKKRAANDSRYLKRKNRRKVIRTLFQIVFCFAVVFWVVKTLFFAKKYTPVTEVTYASSQTYDIPPAQNMGSGAAFYNTDSISTDGFICISYNGLNTSQSLDSRIVTQEAFEEQMAALSASGYVTITQKDVLDYYLYGTPLPDRAMLIVFEDGIFNTTTLAQQTLEKYNYIATACTYADQLGDTLGRYITTANMKKLLRNSYWELGSNGYRLSYINIFDRYGNYFGHLNSAQYQLIHDYLRRDYNHYLMDFLRDEDRLREESEAAMRERIAYDYEQMEHIYESELGYVPSLYILMHSNTGAFGNDPLVSRKNHEMITETFDMNFNRQGSCYNTRNSSVYDLTRLQSRHYFSTNHLLMRIYDDTGHSMAFVVGDEKEAQNWYVDDGVAEFRGNEIILTSEPYGRGLMTLKSGLIDDLDMTVTLQGNKVGRQSIYLRTDRSASCGVEVALEYNELVVRDLSAGGAELFRLNLFEFDGGPFVSEEEDELLGLIALQEAIIAHSEDAYEVTEAQLRLQELKNTTVVNIEEGGTPYYPELDIADRDERKLRIQLVGSRLSLWLDDQEVVSRLAVSPLGRGNIALGAEVWKETDRYSQTNLADDVYDAVFIDPVITDVNDEKSIYYQYRIMGLEQMDDEVTKAMKSIISFFNTRL